MSERVRYTRHAEASIEGCDPKTCQDYDHWFYEVTPSPSRPLTKTIHWVRKYADANPGMKNQILAMNPFLLAEMLENFASLARIREDFCAKFHQWAVASYSALPTDSPERKAEREEFYRTWQRIYLAIDKSNLLWRLLYANETLRDKPCPVHKGVWSGVGANPGCGCWSYGNITGWLAEAPENADAPSPPVVLVQALRAK